MEIIAMIYIVFIIIAFLLPRKNLNILVFIFSLIMGIISYFIRVDYEMDLYRHYLDIEILRSMGWDAVSQDILMDQSLFVKNVYMYLISLTDYNGLLPAITIFFDYYLNLTIIYRCGMRYKVSSVYIVLGMILFMSGFNYWMAVSGIRNWLAFAIFNYFLYKEIIEEKCKLIAWGVYILLCLFHPSMLILLMIRCLILIKRKLLIKIIAIILISWSFFTEMLLALLVQFSGNPLITLLYLKINVYALEDDDYHYLTVIYYLCFTLIIALLCTFYRKIEVQRSDNINKYIAFFLASVLFIIGSISFYDVEKRFAQFITIFSAVFSMLTYTSFDHKDELCTNILEKEKSRLKKKIFSGIVFLFIIFSFYYLFAKQFSLIVFDF